MQQTMRLLQGLSTTSSAAMYELAAIAHLVKDRTLAREVIESRRGDLVERLEQVDPAVAERLRQYLQIWGLRSFGSDAGSPSVAERPELVADLLADDHRQLEAHSPRAFPPTTRTTPSSAHPAPVRKTPRSVACVINPP